MDYRHAEELDTVLKGVRVYRPIGGAHGWKSAVRCFPGYSRFGARALIKKTFDKAGVELPGNCPDAIERLFKEELPCDRIEAVARFCGWVRSAMEHRGVAAEVVKLMFPRPERGAGSPYNFPELAERLTRWWRAPGSVKVEELRGLRWVTEHYGRLVPSIDNKKVFEYLGRVSPPARHVLLHGIIGGGKLTHRDMRWDLLAQAQGSVRKMEPYLPKGMQLAQALGCHQFYVQGQEVKVWHYKPEMLAFWRNLFAPEKGVRRTETVDAILRLSAVFQSVAEMEKFCVEIDDYRNGVEVNDGLSAIIRLENALHDRANVISLPPQGMISQWRQWGAWFNQAPAQWRRLARTATHVVGFLGRMPKSRQEAMDVADTHFKTLRYDLTPIEQKYVESTPTKTSEWVPAPVVTPNGVYRIEQVRHDDPLNIIAGRLVDCCQHLSGVGASAARDIWEQPTAALWAVFKADEVISCAMVWRTKGDELVFDSVECLPGHCTNGVIIGLYVTAMQSVIGRMGVRGIRVGSKNYGITLPVTALAMRLNKKLYDYEDTPDGFFGLRYTDAKKSVLVFKRKRVYPKLKSGASHSSTTESASNTFVPGSGVFCEHCEAEVHPDCEICPSCGTDISEWVD